MRLSSSRSLLWSSFVASRVALVLGRWISRRAWATAAALILLSGAEAHAQKFKAVEAGHQHTLLLRDDGTLWGAGYNYDYQLGDGVARPRESTPVLIASDVVSMSAGYSHSFYVTSNGGLWAMGSNVYAQLGDGSKVERQKPTLVNLGIQAAEAAYAHSFFLGTDGVLYGSGAKGLGGLGLGDYGTQEEPAQIATSVASVSSMNSNSVFVKTNGTLWGMGYNQYGELGLGHTNPQTTPVQITSGVTMAAAGYSHTAFVKTDGSLWAMGRNQFGELGDGTTTFRPSPGKIATGVAKVWAGEAHTVFLKTDGSLWGCGYNGAWQLGDGTTETRLTPIKIADNVLTASCGGYYTVFIKNDGTVWATGRNQWGELADGTTWRARKKPVQIAGPNGFGVPTTDPLYSVSTVAQGQSFGRIAVAADKTIYFADSYSHVIRRRLPSGKIEVYAGVVGTPGSVDNTTRTSARFWNPSDVAIDGAGNLYVADSGNHVVRKITPSGKVSTLAGSMGQSGNTYGTGSAARFNTPSIIACDSSGNVYVVDYVWWTIRKITPTGKVTSFAGSTVPGNADGTGATARFNSISAMAVGPDGSLFVTDSMVHNVRKVTAAGVVSTLAGPLAGAEEPNGEADGEGNDARFSWPSGIAVAANGTVFVADNGNRLIRAISPGRVVSSIAGKGGLSDVVDGVGQGARFATPSSLAIASDGTLYVSDGTSLRSVTPLTGAISKPSIETQPASQTVVAGAEVTLTVKAKNVVSYTWRRNGVPVVGGTGPSLRLQNVDAPQAGNYDVVLKNPAGTTTSAVAKLQVLPLTNLTGVWEGSRNLVIRPGIDNQSLRAWFAKIYLVIIHEKDGRLRGSYRRVYTSVPSSTGNYVGEEGTYNLSGIVTSEGEINFGYNGGPAHYGTLVGRIISGDTEQVSSEGNTGIGDFDVKLVTTAAPKITTQPKSQKVAIGSNATFQVVTDVPQISTGVGSFRPVTYQWQLSVDQGANWSDVPEAGVYSGTTRDKFTVKVNRGAERDWFRVVVSNALGKVVSNAVTVDGSAAVAYPPTLSSFSKLVLARNASAREVKFTIGDPDTAVSSLKVTRASSNTKLLPLANLTLSGTGKSRTLKIKPAKNQVGTAKVTVKVTDGRFTTEKTFTVEVRYPPKIGKIADQSIKEDKTRTVSFTVSDEDTKTSALKVKASSSNTKVLKTSGIKLSGTGKTRKVKLSPVKNASGKATVTLTVSDGALTAKRSFKVTVKAVNDAPTISKISSFSMNRSTSKTVSFKIGDVETSAKKLKLSAKSSNTSLIPTSGLVLSGSSAKRKVKISPVVGRTGKATITLKVSDGKLSASRKFTVTVK